MNKLEAITNRAQALHSNNKSLRAAAPQSKLLGSITLLLMKRGKSMEMFMEISILEMFTTIQAILVC